MCQIIIENLAKIACYFIIVQQIYESLKKKYFLNLWVTTFQKDYRKTKWYQKQKNQATVATEGQGKGNQGDGKWGGGKAGQGDKSSKLLTAEGTTAEEGQTIAIKCAHRAITPARDPPSTRTDGDTDSPLTWPQWPSTPSTTMTELLSAPLPDSDSTDCTQHEVSQQQHTALI